MNPPARDHAVQKAQSITSHDSAAIPAWAVSPEVWLMFRPNAAFQWLAASPASEGRWAALRRPLFMAILLGCMVSLVTSHRLTLRHVGGGAASGSFLLLGQIVALRLVCGRDRRLSFSQTIDLFFAGYGPWALWILAFSSVWAFASTRHAFIFGGAGSILPTAGLVGIWSLYINYRFFERAMQRSRARAVWDVVRLLAMCWSISVVIFGWGALWSEYMRMLGR